jgi:hypothetical protein
MRGWVLPFSLILAAAALLGLGTAYAACAGEQCDKPSAAYGAIAYGAKSTAYGTSSDQRTQQEAERGALADCRQNGDDCELVASFSQGCAAVAAIESKGVFSTGKGDTEQKAEDAALQTCERVDGRGCEIEVWNCATP